MISRFPAGREQEESTRITTSCRITASHTQRGVPNADGLRVAVSEGCRLVVHNARFALSESLVWWRCPETPLSFWLSTARPDWMYSASSWMLPPMSRLSVWWYMSSSVFLKDIAKQTPTFWSSLCALGFLLNQCKLLRVVTWKCRSASAKSTPPMSTHDS